MRHRNPITAPVGSHDIEAIQKKLRHWMDSVTAEERQDYAGHSFTLAAKQAHDALVQAAAVFKKAEHEYRPHGLARLLSPGQQTGRLEKGLQAMANYEMRGGQIHHGHVWDAPVEPWAKRAPAPRGREQAHASVQRTPDQDVVAGLQALGYDNRQAQRAAASVPAGMDTEESLRLALQSLAPASANPIPKHGDVTKLQLEVQALAEASPPVVRPWFERAGRALQSASDSAFEFEAERRKGLLQRVLRRNPGGYVLSCPIHGGRIRVPANVRMLTCPLGGEILGVRARARR